MWSVLLSLINSYQFRERMDTIWILVCIFSLFCYYWKVEDDGRGGGQGVKTKQRISYVAWACKVGIQQMFFIFLLFFTLPALPHVISFSFFVWISLLPRGGVCVRVCVSEVKALLSPASSWHLWSWSLLLFQLAARAWPEPAFLTHTHPLSFTHTWISTLTQSRRRMDQRTNGRLLKAQRNKAPNASSADIQSNLNERLQHIFKRILFFRI